jgi:hypothetical protein
VSAGYGYTGTQTHEFSQHFRARYNRYATFFCCACFGIIFAHGSGFDNYTGIAQIGRIVPDMNFCAQSAQSVYYRAIGQIRTMHLVTEIEQHFGNAAHTGPSDADHMDNGHFIPHFSIPSGC